MFYAPVADKRRCVVLGADCFIGRVSYRSFHFSVNWQNLSEVDIMANRVLIGAVLAGVAVVVFLAIFLPVYLTQTGKNEEPKPTQLTPDEQFYRDVKDVDRLVHNT